MTSIAAQAMVNLGSLLLLAGLAFDVKAYTVAAPQEWRDKVQVWARRLTLSGTGLLVCGLATLWVG